jgi:hypothetical protein
VEFVILRSSQSRRSSPSGQPRRRFHESNLKRTASRAETEGAVARRSDGLLKPNSARTPAAAPKRKLGYRDQRDFDIIEARIAEAEAHRSKVPEAKSTPCRPAGPSWRRFQPDKAAKLLEKLRSDNGRHLRQRLLPHCRHGTRGSLPRIFLVRFSSFTRSMASGPDT